MIFITYMRDEALGWILGKRCLAVFLHAHEKTFKIRMPNELFFIFLPNDYPFLIEVAIFECTFLYVQKRCRIGGRQ